MKIGIAALVMVIALSIPVRGDQLSLAANFWEPFTGESLPYKGFASQIVTEALTLMGYEPEVIIMPWARLLRELENGEVDGVIGIWDTADRGDIVYFSQPYYLNQLCLIKQSTDRFEYHGLNSLHSKLVGVGRNYDYSPRIMKADMFSRAEAVTLGQNLARLARGRIDLVLSDCEIARYYLSNLNGNIRQKVTLMTDIIESSPLHFGISRKHPQAQNLIHDFNQGLAEMRRQGRYEVIFEQWNIPLSASGALY